MKQGWNTLLTPDRWRGTSHEYEWTFFRWNNVLAHTGIKILSTIETQFGWSGTQKLALVEHIKSICRIKL